MLCKCKCANNFIDVLVTKTNNPQLKMYDADIQSMDAAAKGAKVDATTN
jgi:hypothetical protein